ncbi:hypothetical protein GCM10010191_06000 [Actinomadura vinacea]|uniref:Histidine kinase/HSP90-like ATPase domain-containing protein n=1 Tax=Actinomadura vinacea TaxID=115336 RepID=A0ABP5VEX7_9ACTN
MTEAEPGFPPARTLDRGGCAAMRLPPDESIARVARAGTAATLSGFGPGLPPGTIDDAVLLVSELATNALRHGLPRAPDGDPSPAHPIELWIYAREAGRDRQHSELVVKVFDGTPHWPAPAPAAPDTMGTLLEHGRGLVVVDALSEGRWGHHLSRSRLSDPAVPGKATWFGLPIPPLHRTVHTGAAHAAEDLHALLARRGLRRLIRRNERGVSVLSVKENLTVWCEAGSFQWRVPGGGSTRLARSDITEACEQIVQLHETLTYERAAGLDRTG